MNYVRLVTENPPPTWIWTPPLGRCPFRSIIYPTSPGHIPIFCSSHPQTPIFYHSVFPLSFVYTRTAQFRMGPCGLLRLSLLFDGVVTVWFWFFACLRSRNLGNTAASYVQRRPERNGFLDVDRGGEPGMVIGPRWSAREDGLSIVCRVCVNRCDEYV